MTNPIDPEKLDRLIDGELTNDEIRQLVQQIDSNAVSNDEEQSGWRAISLAFIEDRIWETEIKKAVIEDRLPEQTSQYVDDPVQPRQPSEDAPNFLRWLSLAAGLLMAISIGYLVGQGQVQPALRPIANDPSGSNVASSDGSSDSVDSLSPEFESLDNNLIAGTPSEKEINNVSFQPKYHVGLQDAEGNQILGGDIPLYSLKDMQANYPAFDQPPISDELRDQLYKQGYEVNQHTRYISGELKDGRRVVVPIRTINLSSGQ